MKKSYVWDVETNGLLPTMDRVHCLCIRQVGSEEVMRFRRNDEENTIQDGLDILSEADELIGHNIIGFDLKAVRKVYPDFTHNAEVIDTLVLIRMLPIDFKQKDSVLVKKKLLPGVLHGSHSLDAWGYRLGKRKGDYSKQMIEKGLDPWAHWNIDMEDYCVNDVDVNMILWEFIQRYDVVQDASDLEHACQSLVTYMEHSGFPFKQAEALKLADELKSDMDSLVAEVSENVCEKFVPEKKHVVGPLWIDPDGINQAKTYKKPRTEWGEDLSRSWWAEITIPKKTMRSKDPTKRGDRTEGAAYCKLKRRPFNPTSRDHVREFLVENYNWVPQDWTDTGTPSVNDTALKALAETVPEALPLAKIYTLQKLLGYLVNGGEAWTKKYNEKTESIHPYTNIGGTVTGRCAHAGPNIGQVPSVEVDDDGHPILGYEGSYGYECRSLFYTPDEIDGRPWRQVGVDLSGIEFRMLAEAVAEYDNGELIEVVLSGDIHAYNMEKTGIPSRSIIKRGLYGLLYGAGDPKLGLTVAPEANPDDWANIGRRFRNQLMEGLPALKKVIDAVQKQAKNGFIYGLDGRRIFVRSPHSALNTKLQSAAALVAKRWLVFTEDFCLDAGLNHGWDGDFAMLAFVHDEIQSGVAEEHARTYADLCIEAAKESGLSFDLKCPIDAEAKIGHNWAECH